MSWLLHRCMHLPQLQENLSCSFSDLNFGSAAAGSRALKGRTTVVAEYERNCQVLRYGRAVHFIGPSKVLLMRLQFTYACQDCDGVTGETAGGSARRGTRQQRRLRHSGSCHDLREAEEVVTWGRLRWTFRGSRNKRFTLLINWDIQTSIQSERSELGHRFVTHFLCVSSGSNVGFPIIRNAAILICLCGCNLHRYPPTTTSDCTLRHRQAPRGVRVQPALQLTLEQ